MRFIDLRHLSGPNVYSSRPVTIARLELDGLSRKETTGYPGFTERLTMALPGLASHHCAAGRPGGFADALADGTYFGHVTEHVALELSARAGRDVHLGRTMWAGADGRYDVMMECPQDEPADSAVPAELVTTAMRIVKDILAKRRPDFSADLNRISRLVERERLGVSTAAIAAVARRRGIPVRRVGTLSMLRLGTGCHRRLICAALTEQSSAIGVDIAADKVLTKQLLASAGIPVPEGVVACSPQEAADALTELGAPVVIKPCTGNHGANITVGVRTAQQAATAYEQAAAASSAVIVEKLVSGSDYRVLIIDGQLAAAAELRPACVTGDGEHTIIQLVAQANADPRRGEGHSRELTRITLDEAAAAHLDEQGMDGHSVPAAGQVVTLRRNANLSTGGTSRDVTGTVHDEVAEMCRRAAAVSGLDICGIDIRLADISAPLLTGGCRQAPQGAVLELNACPGLRMHLSPTEGAPRDVAAAIVDKLYPPGAPSRIPVIAVTGTNGKTTTVRMIGHILRQAGLRVGMSSTDGVYSGGRLSYEADASGPLSAEMVLDDTGVEAAVLETARGGIIRRGLGYDRADVAVITNISADHLGDDGIDDLAELIDVKALVAEQIHDGGTVVLNADDPATAALADRPAVRRRTPVIRYFSLTPGSQVIEQHAAAGGISYVVRGGQLVEIDAGRERQLIGVAELPGAFGGKARHVMANALAAIAAARAAGASAKDIKRALATFTPGDANPGRGNIYQAGESPVILDYGHNAAALDATGQMISMIWPGVDAEAGATAGAAAGAAAGTEGGAATAAATQAAASALAGAKAGAQAAAGAAATAAVTLPGDRRDDLLVETAESIAAWFDRVVVYEDSDLRGRRPGEMRQLIIAAMRRVRPEIISEEAGGPEAALRRAVELSAGGPVLFLYEKLSMARGALDVIGAQPCPEAGLAAVDDGNAVPGDAPPGDGHVVPPDGCALPEPTLEPAPGHRNAPASATSVTFASAETPAAPVPHARPRRRLSQPQPRR